MNALTEFCEKILTFRNFISVFVIPEGKGKKDSGSFRIIGSYQFLK